MILADRQTGGRGRHGRTWHSDAGALTVTFCLTFGTDSEAWNGLNARVAVLACEALARFAPAVRIKWPNDVTIAGRKAAGVLIERVGETVLIGIGVNLASAPPVEGENAQVPCALADHAEGEAPTREAVLAALCAGMEAWLVDPPGMEAVQRAWDECDALRGREVIVTGAGDMPLRGIAEGIDEQGRLRLRGDVDYLIESGTVRPAGN